MHFPAAGVVPFVSPRPAAFVSPRPAAFVAPFAVFAAPAPHFLRHPAPCRRLSVHGTQV